MLTNSLPDFGLHAPKRRIVESNIMWISVFISFIKVQEGKFYTRFTYEI